MSVDWYLRDRGLPSRVNLNRLAERMSGAVRVASHTSAMAQGFEPVSDRPNVYKRAHMLWALRPSEQGSGYVLVRLQDEPAPGIEPRRARRAGAVVVQVAVETDTDPAEAEIPIDHDVTVPLHLARVAEVPTQLKHETDIGELVEVRQAFRPILYGGALTLPANRLLTVSGHSEGAPDADEVVGLDLTQPLYPEEGDDPANFVRIRLRDDETGVEVAILPLEFERFMDARGSYPKAPARHRSTRPNRPSTIGPDNDVPAIGDMDTVDIRPSRGRDDTIPRGEA